MHIMKTMSCEVFIVKLLECENQFLPKWVFSNTGDIYDETETCSTENGDANNYLLILIFLVCSVVLIFKYHFCIKHYNSETQIRYMYTCISVTRFYLLGGSFTPKTSDNYMYSSNSTTCTSQIVSTAVFRTVVMSVV